jgi:hypothetical protein
MVDSRDLTSKEQALLEFILKNAPFDGAQELAAQIQGTKVTGGPPTMLDLEAPKDSPKARVADGPAPIRAFVGGPEGETDSEILIWVKNGRLSGLEFAWYTDTVASELPGSGSIQLE